MKATTVPAYAKDRLVKGLVLASTYWGIDPDVILTKTRKRSVMNAKHSLRWYLISSNDITTSVVGTLTDCDHSNVVYSVKTFNNLSEFDPLFKGFRDLVNTQPIKSSELTIEGKIKSILRANVKEPSKVKAIKQLIQSNEK